MAEDDRMIDSSEGTFGAQLIEEVWSQRKGNSLIYYVRLKTGTIVEVDKPNYYKAKRLMPR